MVASSIANHGYPQRILEIPTGLFCGSSAARLTLASQILTLSAAGMQRAQKPLHRFSVESDDVFPAETYKCDCRLYIFCAHHRPKGSPEH